MPGQKDKLVRETIWGFATKGITFILFILTNIFLARTLGAELFGRWSFLFSILTIIFLISYFGINSSSKKYVAQYNGTVYLNNVIRDSLKVRCIASLCFFILFLILAAALAFIPDGPELKPIFILSSPLIITMGILYYTKDVYSGLHEIRYNFVLNLVEYGLILFIVMFLFRFEISLPNIVFSMIAATAIAASLGLYFLLRNFYKRTRVARERFFLKDVLGYGLSLFFISVGFLILTEVDVVMLGLLSSEFELGIYAVAKKIVIKLPHVSLALAMGTMPVFAKLNKDNLENLKKLFYRLVRFNIAAFSLIVVLIIAFSKYFIPLLFGEAYISSVLPLNILSVYIFFASVSVLLAQFLDYRGLAKKRMTNLLASLAINISLNLLLIPKYGAVGAAAATLISYTPYFLFNWIAVKRCLQE